MWQPKRGRLWITDGSCVRLRPPHRNHVWVYDFITDRTNDGRPFRLFTMLDEFARECLATMVGGRLTLDDALTTLTDLFIMRGARSTFGRTTGPGSAQKWFAADSASGSCSSSPQASGKTGKTNPSTACCGVRYRIGKSSAPCRRLSPYRAVTAAPKRGSDAQCLRLQTTSARGGCLSASCASRQDGGGRPAKLPFGVNQSAWDRPLRLTIYEKCYPQERSILASNPDP